MPLLEFRVYGVPAPQGSKRYVGRGIMVESSKKVRPWRADVLAASMIAVDKNQWSKPITEPVKVQVEFYFPRPKNHYGTGRNAQKLKPSAPKFVTSSSKGDLDKLCRSTLDALAQKSGGLVLSDDSIVVSLYAIKRYVDTEPPGALISVLQTD